MGTNSHTGNLARKCGVKYNGITIGTHARKIISEFQESPKKMSDNDLTIAINKAEKLISMNILN